jgi:hypothetical protein
MPDLDSADSARLAPGHGQGTRPRAIRWDDDFLSTGSFEMPATHDPDA